MIPFDQEDNEKFEHLSLKDDDHKKALEEVLEDLKEELDHQSQSSIKITSYMTTPEKIETNQKPS